MRPAPFRASALAGGLDLDPDLTRPDDPEMGLCGLYVLRHIQRFLDSLGMELVLNTDGDDDLTYHLSGEHELDKDIRDLHRYRHVWSHSELRCVLRDQPRSVPLLHLLGTGCMGWKTISWEGMRIDHLMQPGRLFLLWAQSGGMGSRRPWVTHLHLFAWQAPFPTHSLVTWTNGAELCDGPQPIDEWLQQIAGHIMRFGQPVLRRGYTSNDRAAAWWRDASAQVLTARTD